MLVGVVISVVGVGVSVVGVAGVVIGVSISDIVVGKHVSCFKNSQILS